LCFGRLLDLGGLAVAFRFGIAATRRGRWTSGEGWS
jgi:hypothetical protein